MNGDGQPSIKKNWSMNEDMTDCHAMKLKLA